ncbi:MAG TPA: YHS domain-containing protein [Anaerolineales bacterium]|jgi:Cu+-exporting ATPase
MTKDPVCGMMVEEATARWTYEHEGETFYFCSSGCQQAFIEEPEAYVAGNGDSASHGQHHG